MQTFDVFQAKIFVGKQSAQGRNEGCKGTTNPLRRIIWRTHIDSRHRDTAPEHHDCPCRNKTYVRHINIC